MYKSKKIVAIIPARKNSKGIKDKNIIKLQGYPLISYSICYAKKSKLIDKVFVSTDGVKISKISKKFGANVIDRPKKISNDIIMPDYAVSHAANFILKKLKFDFDIIIFLQPTTPLRRKNELDKAIKHCIDGNYDTVFSGISYKPFLWRIYKNKIRPLSYNPNKRKRSQDINDINETGSYYVVKKKVFLNKNNRFGKKISYFKSDFNSIFEIDTLEDFRYIQLLIKSKLIKYYNIFLPK